LTAIPTGPLPTAMVAVTSWVWPQITETVPFLTLVT
jgi:hypothetical protein